MTEFSPSKTTITPGGSVLYPLLSEAEIAKTAETARSHISILIREISRLRDVLRDISVGSTDRCTRAEALEALCKPDLGPPDIVCRFGDMDTATDSSRLAAASMFTDEQFKAWEAMGEKTCRTCGLPLRPCPKGPGADEPGYVGFYPCTHDDEDPNGRAVARFIHDGDSINYTPTIADVATGDVIVQGDLVGIAKRDIPRNTLGALAVSGVFDMPKLANAGVTIAAGAKVYWDAGNSVATTDTDEGANKYLGKTIAAADADDATVRVRLEQ